MPSGIMGWEKDILPYALALKPRLMRLYSLSETISKVIQTPITYSYPLIRNYFYKYKQKKSDISHQFIIILVEVGCNFLLDKAESSLFTTYAVEFTFTDSHFLVQNLNRFKPKLLNLFGIYVEKSYDSNIMNKR